MKENSMTPSNQRQALSHSGNSHKLSTPCSNIKYMPSPSHKLAVSDACLTAQVGLCHLLFLFSTITFI